MRTKGDVGEQHMAKKLQAVSDEQMEKTFRTNVFSQFYITKAALAHLKKGASIINTTSITAFRGNPTRESPCHLKPAAAV